MATSEFQRRMERVLSARVEAARAREAKPRRLAQITGVLIGTLVCFFVLKAAAMAYRGEAFAAPPPPEAGIAAQIHHWFAGPDPISTTLAQAMRGAARSEGGAQQL